MRKVLLLSPHFDDAVLSAGQFMAGRPDADVVTVFGGMPQEEQLTPYDEKCGFTNSTEAVKVRRDEDRNATAILRANSVYFDIPDGQYGEPEKRDQFESVLRGQLIRNDYEFVLAPLGLGHPDHIFVSDIAVKVMKDHDLPLYLWEDMPLRVIEPELVTPRKEQLGIKEFQPTKIGDGPIAHKIRALSCYASQIGTGILDPYVMYVPERFWKI